MARPPFGNFRIVFNAAPYEAQLADATPPNQDFREAPEEEEEGDEDNRSAGR